MSIMPQPSVTSIRQGNRAIASQPEAISETAYGNFQDDFPDTLHFGYTAQQIHQPNTVFVHGFQFLPGTWNPAIDDKIHYYVFDSTRIKGLAAASPTSPPIESTGNMRAPASNYPDNLAELQRLMTKIAAAAVMFTGSIDPVDIPHHRSRYLSPLTPVSDRITELILEENGEEDLLHRQQQADWLKRIMASQWTANLPQPFIGFDLEEGLFISSWQSDTECNTLTIDANAHKGWYDPWPADEDDNPLPGELDLDTEEAWQRLRSALTTTRP